MSTYLNNKVVLITGASSGIGEATAYAFARAGCRLSLAARNMEKLNQVKKTCEQLGSPAVLAVRVDVAVETDCMEWVQKTVTEFGTVHVLINNAGITMRALFNELNLDVMRSVMDINFWGTVYCTKYALPYILHNQGSVVGISSVAGIKGLPARAGYSASKFAMHGFLESLRIENLKNGLHVGIVCPGYTNSNIRTTALNKQGQPQAESPFDESKLMPAETVADSILNCVVKRKSFSLLSKEAHLTYWLNKFFPAWVDNLVYRVVAKEKDSPFS
ncbi:MAG: SDR family oxidoreductase [Bacteroidota bacterium]|jgi:short-subunit dehydrogenase